MRGWERKGDKEEKSKKNTIKEEDDEDGRSRFLNRDLKQIEREIKRKLKKKRTDVEMIE